MRNRSLAPAARPGGNSPDVRELRLALRSLGPPLRPAYGTPSAIRMLLSTSNGRNISSGDWPSLGLRACCSVAQTSATAVDLDGTQPGSTFGLERLAGQVLHALEGEPHRHDRAVRRPGECHPPPIPRPGGGPIRLHPLWFARRGPFRPRRELAANDPDVLLHLGTIAPGLRCSPNGRRT